MNVILEESIFKNPEIAVDELSELIILGLRERHYVLTSPLDSTAIKKWLNQRDVQMRARYELAFNQSLIQATRYPVKRTVHVRDLGSAIWETDPKLPVSVARTFLSKPFQVFVENEHNDRNFLLFISSFERRRKLLEMEAKGHLRFQHCGGIEGIISKIESIKANPVEFMGGFVVSDSDSLAPGKPSLSAKKLQHLCDGLIGYHPLNARAIENYIPQAAYWVWVTRQNATKRPTLTKRIKAFYSLTKEQRWHFNVKEGFKADLKRSDAANVGNLFSDINPDTRKNLHSGIDPNVCHIFIGLHDSEMIRLDDEHQLESEMMIDNVLSLL